MKITKKVIINQPASDVWHLIANDFDRAYLWMGPIPHSYEIGEGKSVVGAPMEGRMCLLTEKPEGPRVREMITQYDEQNKSLTFSVNPVNVPAIVPIKQNSVQMSVKAIDETTSEVTWVSRPQLKLFAYLIYPLLRFGIPKAFTRILAGLKEHAENSKKVSAVTA